MNARPVGSYVVDYEEAWAPFSSRFDFRPDYYGRAPAVQLSDDCLVIDLAPVIGDSEARGAAGFDAINAEAMRAFVWLAGDEELVALDWQHDAFAYSPARIATHNDAPPISVVPDGDYYAHMPRDLRWGTFGHPWQQTLTLWGDDLVSTLGPVLLAWLPRHPHTRR